MPATTAIPSTHSRKELLVVDDHPVVRKGLVALLEGDPELRVTLQAGSGEEALTLLDQRRADCAVVDMSLPNMSGLELVKHLHGRNPDLPILMLSIHDERIFAERALSAGARGYVMKGEPPETILRAVRRILSGHVYTSNKVTERIVSRTLSGDDPLASPEQSLSDRELEVFEKIGQGHSTREIARKLHLSVKTIESHRAHIKEKLGLDTGAELVQHAVRWVQAH